MNSSSSSFHHLDTLAQHRDAYKDSRRVAIIDLGSNSFRLIVVEYVPNLSFRVVDEVRESVRLSEGMAEANILRAHAMERAARAVRIYAAFCRASGITDVVAVGTSAIRDADNRDRFLARLEAESGLRVRVLSGEEEAYYGYLAAVNSTTLGNGFVIDLGGGSLEITHVHDRRMKEAISLPLGAVRVTERFLRADPATPKEMRALQEHLREQFAAVKWFRAKPDMMLVGEGGTLRLAARLAQRSDRYLMETLHGYRLKVDRLKGVLNELADREVSERIRMPFMKADRADISLGGVMVIEEAMRAAGFDEMTICSQGMREGLFYERFLVDHGLPIFENVRQSSVLNLAHLYRIQERHAEHITHLTLSMFDQLPESCHDCGPAEREILWAASILHDIGVAVDYHDHHDHGAYLVLNAGLPGYTHREIALIALLIRYHRRGSPASHEFASLLDSRDERCLVQLTALLRLAEQLDRSRDGVVRDVVLTSGSDWAQMELQARGDGQVALWAVENNRDIFEQAFGLKLEVTMTPASAAPRDAE